MRLGLIAAAALLAYAAYRHSQGGQGADLGEGGAGGDWLAAADDVLTEGVDMLKGALGGWRAPAEYAPMIRAAEARYGIPGGMLERLLWQESRYRPEIINGVKRSPVGAIGIAQFMPATAKDLGIDPLNVPQAIDGAGRYLKSLYRQTGDWAEALAAYNWGIGNVQRKGLERAPAETRNYFSQILNDLGMA